MAFNDCCMVLSAVGFVYLLLVGFMLSNHSESLHHFEPEENSSTAFILAALAYAVIYGVLAFNKYCGKTKHESVDKFLNRRQDAGQQYYQMNEVNQSRHEKPQEIL